MGAMAKGIASRTNFDPAEYSLVGCYYTGGDTDIAFGYEQFERILRHRLNHLSDTAFDALLTSKCDSCGTYFDHGAVLRHDPTGNLLSVGSICANEYFMLKTSADFIRKEASKAKERAALKAKVAEDIEFTLAQHPGLADALQTDHYIVQDIKTRFEQYGSLSDPQVSLVFKIAKQEAERAARIEAEAAEPKVAVPEGTQTVTGEVLTTRFQDSYYGTTLKMLVKVSTPDGSYKVWGTVPSAIDDASKGDTVTFTATFERSEDDEFFGFYKRPRKAELEYTSRKEVAQ